MASIPSSAIWFYGSHAVAAAIANPHRQIFRLLSVDKTPFPFDEAQLSAASEKFRRPNPESGVQRDFGKFIAARCPSSKYRGFGGGLAEHPLESLITTCPPQATWLVLDQITDPHNFGAILRSAAAFGVTVVLVTDRHAPPMSGLIAKTASGGVERVTIVRVVNLARALGQLRDADFWRIGLAESGRDRLDHLLHKPPPMARVALILGAEGSGMRRLTSENCDILAQLPTERDFSTLNVSNAAAIALYECRRRFG